MPIQHKKDDYLVRIENKVREQIRGENIGFLLGAGASALDGQGYPMAAALWDVIKSRVKNPFQEEIQAKLDTENVWGIEQALDLLDDGKPEGCPHRHLVIEAIAAEFLSITPPLDSHAIFLEKLSKRRRKFYYPIFCLNYDPLLEKSAEFAKIRIYDGFHGHERAFFDGNIFREIIGIPQTPKKRGQAVSMMVEGLIHLIKLHGSMGWFIFDDNEIRRIPTFEPLPPNGRRLMIPPQHRKMQETTTPPYSTLWTFYNQRLVHGQLLNRLACIGYGMRDYHVNAPIEQALANRNFTLLILSRSLGGDVFKYWSKYENTLIVTKAKCSMRGEIGPGHPTLWDFQYIAEEVI